MSELAAPEWALRDLHAVVSLGLERLHGLLEPAEQAVAHRILGLSGAAGFAYARLSARRRVAMTVNSVDLAGVPDPDAACDALVDAGLLGEGATWGQRLGLATVVQLRDWCRERGLPTSGRRDDLVARVVPAGPIPASTRWVHRPHARLVARLERAALMDKRADRGQLVAERLGHVTWPTYEPTGGPVLFRDRDHLLRWEATWGALSKDRLRAGAAVVALQRGDGEAPARLSLQRGLVAVVVDHAAQLRREKRSDEALAWLDALGVSLRTGPSGWALERARCLEDLGDLDRALHVLEEGLAHGLAGARRLAIHRTGRRLARARHRAWVPDPPLRVARERQLTLVPGVAGHRPTWTVDDRDLLVEDAAAARLAGLGRSTLRAEGGLLRTLFILLFREAVLASVPGQLPIAHLPGPLDLGRPAFAARRAGLVFRALDAIAAGQAPERIRASCDALQGVRIAGVSRDLTDPEPWVAAAESLGPKGLRTVLGPLLVHGFRAARGLPDLLLLRGPEVSLPGAHPKRVGAGALWIEVKGPGDTLSDHQRVWLDRLQRAGVPAEVWRVRA